MMAANLDEVGSKHRSRNWEKYFDSPALTSEVKGYIESVCGMAVADSEGQLRRGHVKEAFRLRPAYGVVATVMWGYPKGRLPGGKSFVPVFANCSVLADEIVKLKSGVPTAIDACKALGIIIGMGPSTYTKIAHFAGINCREGGCLVYDQMVMRAISIASEPELQQLAGELGTCRQADGKYRSYPRSVQEQTYGRFISAANRLARRLQTTPSHIELELFFRAPRGRATPFSIQA
jgi:hypothetical protein